MQTIKRWNILIVIRLLRPMTTCQCLSAIWTSTIKLLTSVGSHLIRLERNLRMYMFRRSLGYCLRKPRFPCVLPFSQMYPLCCIDIRNFLNQFYFFSDDHFQHPTVIDDTLKKVSKKLRFFKLFQYTVMVICIQ
jgi:hypothetical protein